MMVAAILAALRGLPFLLWPHADFDSDQAIVGLMAKHLAEGRALPIFFYGQQYTLAVEAWLAAPLFLAAGTSITLLKLPLLLINAAEAALLVWVLARDAGLTTLAALAASVFFVVCPPVAGGELVAATGASAEPLLYVLLIWLLRERPALCGVVAGVGFLNREFTIFALSALLATSTVYGWRTWRALVPRWLVLGIVFVVLAELGRALAPFGDPLGPEMPTFQASGTSNLDFLAARVRCEETGRQIGANFHWLMNSNLPTLAGTVARPDNLYFMGPATPPSPFVWTLIVFGLVVAAGRASALSSLRRLHVPPVVLFFALVGLQTVAAYVTSCDVRDPTLIRYTLLTVLVPIGVGAWYLRVEHRQYLRSIAVLLLVGFGGWSATQYVPIVRHYMTSPPVSDQARLAKELPRRGIRYARAGYWDAHQVTFLSDERVIVASEYPYRILTYDTVVSRASGVVYIQREPCPGGERVATRWLCRIE